MLDLERSDGLVTAGSLDHVVSVGVRPDVVEDLGAVVDVGVDALPEVVGFRNVHLRILNRFLSRGLLISRVYVQLLQELPRPLRLDHRLEIPHVPVHLPVEIHIFLLRTGAVLELVQ